MAGQEASLGAVADAGLGAAGDAIDPVLHRLLRRADAHAAAGPLARVPGRDGHDGVLPLRPGEAGLGLAVAQYPLLAEDLVRDDALSVGLSLLLDHLGALHPQVDAHDPPLGCDPRLRE